MKRIDIVYGGQPYSIAGRTIESVQAEIAEAIESGIPYWMRVNSGGGRFEAAFLLIAPGIPLAVLNVKPNGLNHKPDEHDIDLDVDGAFNSGFNGDSI